MLKLGGAYPPRPPPQASLDLMTTMHPMTDGYAAWELGYGMGLEGSWMPATDTQAEYTTPSYFCGLAVRLAVGSKPDPNRIQTGSKSCCEKHTATIPTRPLGSSCAMRPAATSARALVGSPCRTRRGAPTAAPAPRHSARNLTSRQARRVREQRWGGGATGGPGALR